MIINVTRQENNSVFEIGNISMIGYIGLKAKYLSIIHACIINFGAGEWLEISRRLAISELDNCTKIIISEAEAELKKAKEFIKKTYPIRYKWSYYKIIIKNPVKTIIAKCLLK